MTTTTFRLRAFFAALLAAAFMTVAIAGPADAQRRKDEDETEAEGRVFDAKVGEIVVMGQELQAAGDLRGAVAKYNEALALKGVTAYELGVIYQLVGFAYYELDNPLEAIRYFKKALAEGDLLPDERNNLTYNIGQMLLAEGRFREAVDLLEEWLRNGGKANDKVHLNLVYAYSELGEYRNALRHARLAYDKADPLERKHFDALNYLYAELNMPRERLDLLLEMVKYFPQDKGVWTSISALYAEAGEERKAFEINKIMYLNGMLTEEKEINRVIDYYSYYEIPYRGAKIMEREMNRGRIAKTRANYEKLARFYRQAREFDAAIPSLTAAARMSGSGKLYQQLGEAFYAEGKLKQAETALKQALDKGIEKPGDAWVVMGNARYEQGNREDALEAFEEGAKYPYSRRSAEGWRDFVSGEIEAQKNRELFEAQVKRDELRVNCERRAQLDVIDQAPMIDSDTGEEIDCEVILNEFAAGGLGG